MGAKFVCLADLPALLNLRVGVSQTISVDFALI